MIEQRIGWESGQRGLSRRSRLGSWGADEILEDDNRLELFVGRKKDTSHAGNGLSNRASEKALCSGPPTAPSHTVLANLGLRSLSSSSRRTESTCRRIG